MGKIRRKQKEERKISIISSQRMYIAGREKRYRKNGKKKEKGKGRGGEEEGKGEKKIKNMFPLSG